MWPMTFMLSSLPGPTVATCNNAQLISSYCQCLLCEASLATIVMHVIDNQWQHGAYLPGCCVSCILRITPQ